MSSFKYTVTRYENGNPVTEVFEGPSADGVVSLVRELAKLDALKHIAASSIDLPTPPLAGTNFSPQINKGDFVMRKDDGKITPWTGEPVRQKTPSQVSRVAVAAPPSAEEVEKNKAEIAERVAASNYLKTVHQKMHESGQVAMVVTPPVEAAPAKEVADPKPPAESQPKFDGSTGMRNPVISIKDSGVPNGGPKQAEA